LQIGVGLDDRLRQVGGAQMVAAAILHVDDLNVGVGFFDAVDKAVATVDAGAAGLVVDDDRDLSLFADQFSHLVGRGRSSRDVVGGRGGDRNVAVHAGVKADDRDARGLGLFQQGNHSLAV